MSVTTSRGPSPASTATAEALRDQGIATAIHAADPRIVLTVEAVIARHVASGMPFTADDIRAELPVTSRGLVGGLLRSAAMRKDAEIVAIGEVKSSHPATHAKKIKVWQAASEAADPSP